MQVFFTWALAVVPSGMSLRGPHMSLDMCPLAVSVDCGFRRVWIHGCGLERPTWLMRGDEHGLDSRVRNSCLGGHELPAAGSSKFARDCRFTRGQKRGPIARMWEPVCGPQWPARSYQLVGFTLGREQSRWSLGTLTPHPDVVLWIPASTTGFFFLLDKAILSPLRMAAKATLWS